MLVMFYDLKNLELNQLEAFRVYISSTAKPPFLHFTLLKQHIETCHTEHALWLHCCCLLVLMLFLFQQLLQSMILSVSIHTGKEGENVDIKNVKLLQQVVLYHR
ncbi:hypothetical protein POM88_026926 [Heracleum sosnowskyi]|uniref:Uncharacterized protein n=1 Tax=Heracleum sosnowskyi TaxID=360622 RepID=A0AAD8I6R2_9APIA|nr:hypothetical protein POM88_026926 [Heracleum sosnowskyi]